jgi:hypothetical protein
LASPRSFGEQTSAWLLVLVPFSLQEKTRRESQNKRVIALVGGVAVSRLSRNTPTVIRLEKSLSS